MLNTALFGTYCISVGAIIYNQVRIKWQDDFNRELHDYREFDFHDEKFKKEKFEGKGFKCIVLAKYREQLEGEEPAEEDHILF